MMITRWLLASVLMLGLVGCGDDTDVEDAAADASPDVVEDTTLDADDDSGDAAQTMNGGPVERDGRYCELIFVFVEVGGARAEVWGTQGLNTCPDEAWSALDSDIVAADYDASVAILNGPRFWTIDEAVSTRSLSGDPMEFGGIPMQQLATIEFDGFPSRDPYLELTIMRFSTFTWRAGLPVYELTSPEGAVYTMQSFAQTVDPELTKADLSSLGDRLTLPEGWSYAERVLEEDLVITTEGDAVVTQDDLGNTYTRRATGE